MRVINHRPEVPSANSIAIAQTTVRSLSIAKTTRLVKAAAAAVLLTRKPQLIAFPHSTTATHKFATLHPVNTVHPIATLQPITQPISTTAVVRLAADVPAVHLHPLHPFTPIYPIAVRLVSTVHAVATTDQIVEEK